MASRLIKNLREHILFVIVFVLIGTMFWSLLYSHYLLPQPDGIYSAGSVWGDINVHMAMTMNIVERGLRPTLDSNPLYAGISVSYPFLPNYLSALLVRLGLSLRWAFIWPSFLCIMAFTAAMYFVTESISRSRLGAALVPVLFFVNGSLWSMTSFFNGLWKSGRGFWDFLLNPAPEFAYLNRGILDGIDYVQLQNLTLNYILPQRAFIFGLLIGIAAIYFLWRYWNDRRPRPLLYAALLLSALPLVHTHSLISIALISGFLFLGEMLAIMRRNDGPAFDAATRRWLLCFALPVVALALPQFMLIYPSDKSSFLKAGFFGGDYDLLAFWLKNLFPHILVFIAGYALAPRRLKTFYNAFIGLFVVSNALIFQPFVWDNTKFTVWFFLGSLILVAHLFGHLARRYGYRGIVMIVLLSVSMTLVGAIDIAREYKLKWKLYSNEDVFLAEYIRTNTPKESVFATSMKSNNPIVSLAGRTTLHAYGGLLWAYGIDARERRREVASLYSGGADSAEIIKKHRVDYLEVNGRVMNDFKPDTALLERMYERVTKIGDTTLYKVTNASSAATSSCLSGCK